MSSPQQYKPVPKLKASWLMGSWSDFRSDRLALVRKVATECGPMGQFRVGPVPIYLVNSPEVLKQLLVDQHLKATTRPFIKNFFELLGETTLPGIGGDYHRRMRRIMAPVFQHKRLLGYTQQMVEIADVAQRAQRDESDVEIVSMMQQLTLRIMSKTIFALENEEDPRFFHAIQTASLYISNKVADPVRLPLSVPTPQNRIDREAIDYLRNRSMELLVEGQQRGTDKGDVLSMLLKARDEDGSGLTQDELRDQILTLYVSGHETTANALAFSFLELSRHPEVLARLQAELDEVLGGRPPTFEDTPKLRYMHKVIKEVLRMYPAAVFFGRAPLEDMEAGGYLIPKDQFCLISPYTLHRNPALFPDPERFDPERFTPEFEKSLPRNTYMPFGDGPHVCIGQHFAMLEIQLVLAHFCQHFAFTLNPHQSIRFIPQATLTASPFFIRMKRRKSAVALAS